MPETLPNVYEVGNSDIWVANIKINGRHLRLGFFSTKIDAEAAHEAALAKYEREYSEDKINV